METAGDRTKWPIEARLGLFYAAYFAVVGLQTPYLPLWLDWKDLDARQIALVTAVPMFVRTLISPAIAFGSDRLGEHRAVTVGLTWFGLLALLALTQSSGFWPILAVMLVFSLAWTTVLPLAETIAMGAVRSLAADYGRMRVWGSVSFIAASMAGGWLIEHTGAATAIWLILLAVFATALVTLRLPSQAELGNGETPERATFADAIALARAPPFLLFVLAAGAVQASHAVLYVFGVLNWRAQGLSTAWCGALWALSIIVEIVLFARAAAVLRLIDPLTLVLAGGAVAVVRWGAMGFDPPLWLLVPLQLAHAVTFAATHLGAVHFLANAVAPASAATAQALYSAMAGGVAMGFAMVLAGPAYAAYGGRAYWVMAALAALGTMAAHLLRNSWHSGTFDAPPSSPENGGSPSH
jgi:MFS transporter, PPP family, 3-phenylpropionic acid transporter